MLHYKASKLISMIRTGKLKPDASRAERLAMMLEEDAGGGETIPSDEPVEYQTSDDDSEDIASPCEEFDLPELGVPDDSCHQMQSYASSVKPLITRLSKDHSKLRNRCPT